MGTLLGFYIVCGIYLCAGIGDRRIFVNMGELRGWFKFGVDLHDRGLKVYIIYIRVCVCVGCLIRRTQKPLHVNI